MTRFEGNSEMASVPVAPFRVLIADGLRARRAEIADELRNHDGKTVRIEYANGVGEALEMLASERRECLIVAPDLPDGRAVDLVDQAASAHDDTAVILVSDDDEADILSSALRRGMAERVRSRYGYVGDLDAAIRRGRKRITDRGWSHALMRDVRETDAEMDHFVRSLSHDMTANFMLLEHSFQQLKQSYDDHDPDELDESIRHVEACLAESKRFLDDLVRLGRTGTIEMDGTRVDASQIVDEVLYEQRDELAEAGFRVRVAHPLPHVWCNPKRFKQVVTNLVRNAIKHGVDASDPELRIQAVATTGDSGFAAIEIADRGPGVPAEMTEEIFQAGKRGPTRDASGTGMGLAIVRKIVEHYGGTVRVGPTTANWGAAFVFTLPLAGKSMLSPKLPKLTPTLGSIPRLQD